LLSWPSFTQKTSAVEKLTGGTAQIRSTLAFSTGSILCKAVRRRRKGNPKIISRLMALACALIIIGFLINDVYDFFMQRTLF
jgi:hypothetical protein